MGRRDATLLTEEILLRAWRFLFSTYANCKRKKAAASGPERVKNRVGAEKIGAEMKREELVKLGVSEEVIDQIMALHGADVEAHKAKLVAVQTELDTSKAQLVEAGKQIEGFKGMDIDGVKKSADEWKAKAEKAEQDAQAALQDLKFNHALDGALAGAKAKNTKAVRALLQSDVLKLNEDGSILGLKEQLEKIKTDNDFLFESDQPLPQISAKGTNKTLSGDAIVDAARAGANLPPLNKE